MATRRCKHIRLFVHFAPLGAPDVPIAASVAKPQQYDLPGWTGWTRLERPVVIRLIRVHPWLKKSSRLRTILGDTDGNGRSDRILNLRVCPKPSLYQAELRSRFLPAHTMRSRKKWASIQSVAAAILPGM